MDLSHTIQRAFGNVSSTNTMHNLYATPNSAHSGATPCVDLHNTVVNHNHTHTHTHTTQHARKRMTETPNTSGATPSANVATASNAMTAATPNPSGTTTATGGPVAGDVQRAKKPKVTYPVPNQCMENGHFYVVLGEDVDTSTGRYKILSLLGQGTFGKVVEAWDRKLKEYCAVKIVRNTPKYTHDAQIEVKYMERVCQRDPCAEYAIVRVRRNFINDQGHMCIVMPKHGRCLLDYIQKHGSLTISQVAQVAYQLCRTLDYLHTQNRYIHTDLKPENILLNNNSNINPMLIRVCDLGGCSDERHNRLSIVSTRHYRAPEVILGLGWMFPADMWSVGCILYELHTGRLLYDTHNNFEHLNMIAATLGSLPADFGSRCQMEECKQYFSSMAPHALKACARSSRLARCAPIETLVRDEGLASLIRGLLNYDQSKRLTARDVMNHPFVTKYCPESVVNSLNPTPTA